MHPGLSTIATGPPRSRDPHPARTRRFAAAPARQVAVELTPQAVEQVATRVAQLLRHQHQHDTKPTAAGEPSGLLTVAQLAQHLGLSRAWVYEHADQLGAIRLGNGPKARIRFDLHTAIQAMAHHQKDWQARGGS